jgi:hypothetical protein
VTTRTRTNRRPPAPPPPAPPTPPLTPPPPLAPPTSPPPTYQHAQETEAQHDDRARVAHLQTLDLDTMEGSSEAKKALRTAYVYNTLSLMGKVRRPVSDTRAPGLRRYSPPAPRLSRCASHIHHRCSTPTPGP